MAGILNNPYISNIYHAAPAGVAPPHFQQAYDLVHTSYPDYSSIIDRLMAPIRAADEAKLKALGVETDTSKALAQKNAAISQAMMDAAHKRAKHEELGSLTGRGLINSGERNYQIGYLDKTYEQNTSLAANQLLAYLMNLENQLKNAAMEATQQEQQALLNAQQYAATNYSPNTNFNPWAPVPLNPLHPSSRPYNPTLSHYY